MPLTYTTNGHLLYSEKRKNIWRIAAFFQGRSQIGLLYGAERRDPCGVI